MKLFIWNDPYRVYYGSSLLIAVAETEDEASREAKLTRKRRPDITPTLHPATERRKWTAWTHWMELQREHRIASERMWAGTIASSFTADQLVLIADLICPRDRALLESVKRASQ